MTNPACTTPPGNNEGLKHREEVFHDQWANTVDPATVMVDASWTAVTCPEHIWLEQKLGDLRGRKVLDLGCGCGEAAVWFAKRGADVTASDLSAEFLRLVERVAKLHGVMVVTKQVDAETLPFSDNTFDVVYAGNLLHHVDLEKTLVEIKRILKPGGQLASWDPLRHNPIINVYRRMAQPVRTIDEHPLHIREVGVFRKHYASVEHNTFWLFTLWIFLRFWLIERVHPSKDRYWKRVIREHQRLTPIYNRLRKLDDWALRVCPFLRRYCWNIAVISRKVV